MAQLPDTENTTGNTDSGSGRICLFRIGAVLGIAWGGMVAALRPDTVELPGLGPMTPIFLFLCRVVAGAVIGGALDLLISLLLRLFRPGKG
jgi:hypothetical protein